MNATNKTCEACGADRPAGAVRCSICFAEIPAELAGRAYPHALQWLRGVAKRGSVVVSRRSKFQGLASAFEGNKCLRFERYNEVAVTYTVTAYGHAVLASAPAEKFAKVA